MTSDEARDLFTDAYDRTLPAERQVAFDAAVAADTALAAEWTEFRALLDGARTMGATDADEPVPDLLGGVQKKLRARSRGRFYADRFSGQTGTSAFLPIALGALMLLILAVAWASLHLVQVEDAPSAGADVTPSR